MATMIELFDFSGAQEGFEPPTPSLRMIGVAGCHGLDGNGVPNTVVAMRNNSTLRLADPRNLIVAMLDGIGAENFPHRESMQAMPGFSDKLNDGDAAALANYLRVTWGGQKGDVTPATERALR
jgi:mono/diheme cytochrome c family protein